MICVIFKGDPYIHVNFNMRILYSKLQRTGETHGVNVRARVNSHVLLSFHSEFILH